MTVDLSKHASQRQQQRGITHLDLLLILEYGSEEHQYGGDTYYFLTKKDVKKLEKDLKQFDIDRFKKMFAATLSNGRIKTVGHRTHHLVRT